MKKSVILDILQFPSELGRDSNFRVLCVIFFWI